MKQVIVPVTPILRLSNAFAPRESEMLFGETCEVIREEGEYVFVKASYEGYEGYVHSQDLGTGLPPTHKVNVLKTFVYSEANIKSPVIMALPFLAQLHVLKIEANFAQIEAGFIYLPHLQEITHKETDFVAVAERFLHIPYLWGGKSSFGLDCSALVQTAFKACGQSFPRDSGPQSLEGLSVTGQPQRGHLIFWQGHVGIMRDETTLLHANGHTMDVALEDFETAKARIGTPIIGIKKCF